MKAKIFLLGLLLTCMSTLSLAGEHKAAADTVIIKFGNNSQIMILTSSREDLENIEKYDLNKIIRELNMSIKNKNGTQYLTIEDETGSKYLKNATITVKKDDGTVKKIYVTTEETEDDDEDDDPDSDYSEGSKYQVYDKNKTKSTFNIDLGINNWADGNGVANQTNYDIKPFGSWYVGLNFQQRSSLGGALFVEWGPSISWYNWKFEDESIRLEETPGEIQFIRAADNNPDGLEFEKSKLSASYLNFTVVPMLDFSYKNRQVTKNGVTRTVVRKVKNGIRFGVGGYAGLRLGSKTKYVVERGSGDDTAKDRNDYSLSNFRYGVRAQFGYKGLDFFGMYDLNNVFQQGVDPSLNAFAIGIIL